MALTTILFDLDGTLLPMDNDVFVKTYFGLLAKTLAPHGYEAKALVDAVWAGTAAMVANDGRQTNEAVFWEKFAGVFGERVYGDKPVFEAFYANEFQNARSVCGFNPPGGADHPQGKGTGTSAGAGHQSPVSRHCHPEPDSLGGPESGGF